MGTLSTNEFEAKLVKRKAQIYVVMGDTLYKRSYNDTLLRCLYPDKAKSVIKEIHESVYSVHKGSYIIARRTILQGHFWPGMAKQCADYARSCPTY